MDILIRVLLIALLLLLTDPSTIGMLQEHVPTLSKGESLAIVIILGFLTRTGMLCHLEKTSVVEKQQETLADEDQNEITYQKSA